MEPTGSKPSCVDAHEPTRSQQKSFQIKPGEVIKSMARQKEMLIARRNRGTTRCGTEPFGNAIGSSGDLLMKEPLLQKNESRSRARATLDVHSAERLGL
jgi:hypothetical protein